MTDKRRQDLFISDTEDRFFKETFAEIFGRKPEEIDVRKTPDYIVINGKDSGELIVSDYFIDEGGEITEWSLIKAYREAMYRRYGTEYAEEYLLNVA